MVHCPVGCRSQDWARSFVWVSHGCRSIGVWAVYCCFPSCVSRAGSEEIHIREQGGIKLVPISCYATMPGPRQVLLASYYWFTA